MGKKYQTLKKMIKEMQKPFFSGTKCSVLISHAAFTLIITLPVQDSLSFFWQIDCLRKV